MNFRNRLSKLEQRAFPKPRPPQVVHIRHGETSQQAADRYEQRYGQRPSKALGVPEPVTDENRAEMERRFKENQERLYAEVRSHRPKDTEQ